MKIAISLKGTLMARYLSLGIIKASKQEPDKQREVFMQGNAGGRGYALSRNHQVPKICLFCQNHLYKINLFQEEPNVVLPCKALKVENYFLILCSSLFSDHMNCRSNARTSHWHHIICLTTCSATFMAGEKGSNGHLYLLVTKHADAFP